MRIKQERFNHVLRLIILTIIMINSLVITSGCHKYYKVQKNIITSANINNSSTTSSKKEPTDGIDPDWKIIKRPLLLSELLDFDWDDVISITINKYQDNVKVAREIIMDKQYITDIASITSELSVVHTYNNNPDNNIVYEIFINDTKDASKIKFISFGPLLDDYEYAIGGTLIESNNLTRIQYLVQTNPKFTFDKIQEILELSLSSR